MIKTKKPSAILYNWDKEGTFELQSDIYFEENLFDTVVVYSLPYTGNVEADFSLYSPDIIMYTQDHLDIKSDFISKRTIKYSFYPPTNILANDIVCQSTFINCANPIPKFSIFTPTYKTGKRLLRTYESLKNQKFNDWEWVILDDSPIEDETWNLIQELSKSDFRIKPHKIFPLTGGNIGLAKHRAASLCIGEWLLELDHDDYLTKDCLTHCFQASQQFPDAGFLYSDCCELYEDGTMRQYDYKTDGDWYAREDNGFDFGYAGHTWTNIDGVDYLSHHYPEINPLTIRFNISMPNHVRVWKKEVYDKIGKHNINTPVADDFELIIRTFLNTRMVHIRKTLYLQYNNQNSTVDNNAIDINRRARLIRDYYDKQIHNRILELDKHDWNWDEENQHSQKYQNRIHTKGFFENEQVLNYIYE
jgi:glycosyltransferase involved in cell wall biosynthesis